VSGELRSGSGCCNEPEEANDQATDKGICKQDKRGDIVKKKQLYLASGLLFWALGIVLVVITLVGSGIHTAVIGPVGWGSIGLICWSTGSLLLLRYSRLARIKR